MKSNILFIQEIPMVKASQSSLPGAHLHTHYTSPQRGRCSASVLTQKYIIKAIKKTEVSCTHFQLQIYILKNRTQGALNVQPTLSLGYVGVILMQTDLNAIFDLFLMKLITARLPRAGGTAL
jgi:hypothetical protein